MLFPKGIFITFEGTEGCGKSTQIARLTAKLKAFGNSVVQCREPGGTLIGESIRKLLKQADGEHKMCAETELLLFSASRAQLVREVIRPSLMERNIVICDRFMDSTVAYQGAARQLPSETVSNLNHFAVESTLPDLTFFLDVPAKLGLERARQRAALDRIEQESIDFFERICKGFRQLAKDNAKRIITIDGTQTIDAIETQIFEELQGRFA